jgi:hypothetical protein
MKCNSIPNISSELINNLISPIKHSQNKSSGGRSANKN